MEIRQLRHFLAVAEAGNFRRAGERVHISQQAVSKSISQLEQGLNVKLFERGRHSVMLTEQGRWLLAYAQDILADVRRFDDALADLAGDRPEVLRIGATPNLLVELVPSTLLAISDRYSAAKFVVERGNFAILRDLMLQGELDIVLTPEPLSIPRNLLSIEAVGQDANVVVARSGHPLTGQTCLTEDDLARYPFVMTRNYPRGQAYLERIMAGRAMPAPRLLTASTQFAVSWLQKTDCWWIASHLRVRHLVRDGNLVVLDVIPGDENWNISVSTRRYASGSAIRDAWVAILRQHLASG